MSILSTRSLLIAATACSALMAGFNLDRAVVHNAAWHELGAAAWATYSLHADLSARAALLYPLLGIGAALLSVSAMLSLRAEPTAPRAAVLAAYAAAGFAVTGLLTTILAGPDMLSVPILLHDIPGLRRALDGFVFWGDIRGLFQFLAFPANLAALSYTFTASGRGASPASSGAP